ncbi:MAG: hypothetical protein KGQ88_11435, partial [Chloroflexi bacterium]|nr:hypothetical protein [Chloroflexota bacterium]
MRELVRSDLPELAVAGERVRGLVTRSSLPFALLAGIGADRIAGDVVRTIGFPVLSVLHLQNSLRAYDVQQLLAPALGMIVARRAGGRTGALAYVAYFAFTVGLRWSYLLLSCSGVASGGQPAPLFCSSTLLGLLPGALPPLAGLAIGAVIATRIADATRTGTNALLEGAGSYAAVFALATFGASAIVFSAYGVSALQAAFSVGVTLVSGMLAGATIALRSTSPLRTALLLVVLFVATWIYPFGASQLQMALGADWGT